MFSRVLHTSPVLLFLFAQSATSSPVDDPLPSIERVKSLLMPGDGPGFAFDDDGKRIGEDPLMKFGDRIFPIYEQIFSDPKSDPGVVTNALYAIKATNAKRDRFLKPTIEFLANASPSIRSSALELLGEIGSDRDTAPAIALLSDDNYNVRRDAARTLSKIGGKRDVVAVDIWLKVGNHRNDGDHVRLVKKYRDELDKRLKDSAIKNLRD